MMWLAAMKIRAACDHVVHANSTLVDGVDLATPLSLSSQRLPASPLLLPHSGLSRSDLVQWPDADLPQRQLLCPLLGLERTRYAQRELFRF